MCKLMLKITGLLIFIFTALLNLQAQEISSNIVEITNEATCNPAELVISQGEKITWHNKSDGVQTITVKTRQENKKLLALAPKDAEPFSSGEIKPGETFTYTFYEPGTYELISLPNADKNKCARVIVKE